MTRDCFNTEAKRWPEAMRANDFLSARNTLTQVHHGSASETTIKLNVSGMADGQRAGLAMLQVQPNWIGIVQADDQRRLTFASAGTETPGPVLAGDSVQLRMHVADETVHYEYSLDDGKTFASLGTKSKMRFSWWKGARPALFSYSLGETNLGHADFDWVRIKQIAPAKR